MNNEKEIRFIEMFCGVGGFRLGLEGIRYIQQEMEKGQNGGVIKTELHEGKQKRFRNNDKGCEKERTSPISQVVSSIKTTSGPLFRCVWANDNDKYACQVYREKFGDKELVEGDIRKISTKEIPEFDLLTGGFPCQAFSVAGKRRGFQDQTRGTLFFEICRVVRDKKPRFLLLENVKGLLSHESGRTFAIILLSLDELGYDVEWQVLNTKYWLPQNRERVFIFGIRRKGR